MSSEDQQGCLGVDNGLSEQVLACLTENGLITSKSGAVEMCIVPIGVMIERKKDKALKSKYLKIAQNVLELHKVNVNTWVRFSGLEVGEREWIKGLTLIVAGALLCRYPFARKLGIAMIKLGIGYIGWEYYDTITDYLIDHKILREKIELRK